MSEDNRDFPKKIATYLDAATTELKPGTAYRLQLARQEALARVGQPRHVAELKLAPAGAGGTGSFGATHSFWANPRLWVGVALIVVAAFGYQQWSAYQDLKEIEETDAALLASDLPIDAYLDRGFENWLKSVSDD